MTVDDRDLEAAMAALLTNAPPSLAPNVLADLGLADLFARFDSPIGPLVVAWNGLGVSAVEDASDDAAFEADHRARTGRPAHRADRLPDRLATAIGRRLEGDRRVRIDLDLRGHTEFERDVWHKALEIPRGEVRPYGWVSGRYRPAEGGPRRRHGAGHNPVPLIVPCHRVVRSDGTIGQYSLGGQANKRTILAAEGLDTIELEAAARAGVRFVGSDSTHIVCMPTCRHARRVTTRHRCRSDRWMRPPRVGIARAASAGPCRAPWLPETALREA